MAEPFPRACKRHCARSNKAHGLGADRAEGELAALSDEELLAAAAVPTPERIQQVGDLLRRGVSIEMVHDATRIDPWFLDQMSMITEERAVLAEVGIASMTVVRGVERSDSGSRRAARISVVDR